MTGRCFDNDTVAAFVAGEIESSERADLERHLDECEACRELVGAVARGVDAHDVATSDGRGANASSSAPVSATHRDGPMVAGRFIVEGMAGRGGMATVFRARDARSGEVVALKLLHSGFCDEKRTAREVGALAGLDHPAVVRYLEHGRDDGRTFVVMEWLDGVTLEERIRAGRLDARETIALGLRIAEGLHEVHARRVVHRDVKPSNLILVDGRIEEARIVDFGVARTSTEGTRLTLTGAVIGTAGYMAPEQARAQADVDARADVFALGAVLYHAITGQRPFGGADLLAILIATVLETPPRPSELRADVPEELDDLVMAMLAKAPSDRPASTRDVLDRLASARDRIDVMAMPPSRSLTTGERRLVSVVVVRAAAVDERVVSEIAAQHGGSVDALIDGSLFVAVAETGGASDQAVRAARCALLLKEALPDAAIALATRRALGPREALPLPGLARATIHTDDVTAGLLDARFEIFRRADSFELYGERPIEAEGRTLLGKPSPCVGRERELLGLEAIFVECVTDSAPRKVLVAGEAGIGKTRVRRELVTALARRHDAPEIWIGRGDPMSAGSSFALLLGALAKTAGFASSDPPDLKRARISTRARRSVPDATRVAVFLAEAAGAPFAEDVHPALHAARRDPTVMADQITRAWHDLVAAECATRPLVVVLEDAHWGDHASIAILDAAVRALDRSPLLVIAFARSEVRELFPELTIARGAEEVNLRPLAKRASEELVRSALGESVDATDRIVDLAQGHPFFLEELIRAASEGRAATLPETVLALVEARLAALTTDERRVLRAASVFGGVFWRGGVLALLGRRARDEALDVALASLAQAELVTEQRTSTLPDDREFRFRHALVRESAYATLTEEDLQHGHAAAGDWLAARGAADTHTLAMHFHRGGDRERAAAAYHRAAVLALEANDAAAARDLATRAADSAGDARTPAVGAMLLVRAEAHLWLSEHAFCEDLARSAIAMLEVGTTSWFSAQRLVAQAAGALGHGELFTEAERAIASTSATGDAAEERAKAIHALLARLWFKGDLAAYEALAREAESAAPSSPALLARSHREKARAALRDGDIGAYTAMNRSAAELANEAGDLRYALMLESNVGNGLIALGMPERAEALLREALARAAWRFDYLAMGASVNLAHARSRLGAFDEARAALEAAIARAAGDRRFEGGCRIYLADALLGAGDLDAAEAEARRAVAILELAPPLRPRALASLARVLLASGRAAEARSIAEEAMRAIETAGLVEEGDALVRLVDAEAKRASGDEDAARVAIAAARKRLYERAAKIRDASLRQSFLERVAENARTLAIAAELAGHV